MKVVWSLVLVVSLTSWTSSLVGQVIPEELLHDNQYLQKLAEADKRTEYLFEDNGDTIQIFQIMVDPARVRQNVATKIRTGLFLVGNMKFVSEYLLGSEVIVSRAHLHKTYMIKAEFSQKGIDFLKHLVSWLEGQDIKMEQSKKMKQGFCIVDFNIQIKPVSKFKGSMLSNDGGVYHFQGYKIEGMLQKLNQDFSNRLVWDAEKVPDGYFNTKIDGRSQKALAQDLERIGLTGTTCEVQVTSYSIK